MRRAQDVPRGNYSSGPQSRSRSSGQHVDGVACEKKTALPGGGSIEQDVSENQLIGAWIKWRLKVYFATSQPRNLQLRNLSPNVKASSSSLPETGSREAVLVPRLV